MKIKEAGFLLINKPKMISSFTVVKLVRNLVGNDVRVGHAGTLDTFAHGLLIIAIDRKATKHIRQFLSLDKSYEAQGKLGERTDTLDYTGTVVQTNDTIITQQALEKAILSLGSSYIQKAPIYSALKHKGMRLSDLARNNQLSEEKLDRIALCKQREVTLHQLTLLHYAPPFYTIKAHVSSGTYIRSLIHDIAQKAGSIAATYELERTTIGPFNLGKAVTLEDLSTCESIENHLISIEKARDMIALHEQNARMNQLHCSIS